MDLGYKIFENRKKLGLSQEELGEKLNVSRQSVSLWENNQAQPSLENLKCLATLFNVSVDELCGNDLLHEEIATAKNSAFCTSTVYNEEVYKSFYTNFYKKHLLYLFVGFAPALLLLLDIIFLGVDALFIIFPLLFIASLVIGIVKTFLNIKKLTLTSLTSKPNLKSDFCFYDDRIEIKSVSDNYTGETTKKYDEIRSVLQTTRYVYVRFDDCFFAIDKNNLNENADKLNYLLNLPRQKNNAKSGKIKVLLLSLFVLSLSSIMLALICVAIAVNNSPIPSFPLVMAEYLWIFFLFVPLPLSSLVLGIIFLQKGYKCKKNIIAGTIMSVLLCLYGCFTPIFAHNISHDAKYVNDLSATVQLDVPTPEYVAITYELYESCESMAMIKISEADASDFVMQLELSGNWKRDHSSFPPFHFDFLQNLETADYEYFCFYNLSYNEYNAYTGSAVIYMAYDVQSRVLFVYQFKDFG